MQDLCSTLDLTTFSYPGKGSVSLVCQTSDLPRAKGGVSMLQKWSEPGVKYTSFVYRSFVNYSECISTYRGTWKTTVHSVKKSWIWHSDWTTTTWTLWGNWDTVELWHWSHANPRTMVGTHFVFELIKLSLYFLPHTLWIFSNRGENNVKQSEQYNNVGDKMVFHWRTVLSVSWMEYV